MEKLNLTCLSGNSDTVEGRGPLYTLGYFRSREPAIIAASDERFAKYGVWGRHDVESAQYLVKPVEIVIYDSASEFWDVHDDLNAIRAAKAKLTDKELKLLGLER